MARLLTERKSTYGSPYAYYTLDVSASSRTPTTVKLSATAYAHLKYSSSWIGTGKGYGLVAGIYAGGTWHTWTLKAESNKWSGTASHSASTSFTLSGLGTSNTAVGLKFRVLRTSGAGNAARLNELSVGNVPIGSVAATYANVKIAAAGTDQAQTMVTLSGLPASVGYAREIRWYKGGTKVATTPIAATSSGTSFSQKFTGLLPNTDYSFKAVVVGGSVTLAEKSIGVATPQETGELSLAAKSTYITAKVTGMFGYPNYTRSIEFYIKKSVDKEYKLFTTVTSQLLASAALANITGLVSNVKYDVKVLVKNGNTILLTLTQTAITIKDTSLIPVADIEKIAQRLGTRKCTLTWIVNKAVAGTIYTVQAKTDNDSAWVSLSTLSEVESPLVVTAKSGNVNTLFRIAAANEAVAASTVNYSDEYEFYVRDDFVWDSEKTKGTRLTITANEWNRLTEYAISRNREAGKTVSIPAVKTGDSITAAAYNTMKKAISNVSAVGIADKKRGDIITASDIDALRVAINKVS